MFPGLLLLDGPLPLWSKPLHVSPLWEPAYQALGGVPALGMKMQVSALPPFFSSTPLRTAPPTPTPSERTGVPSSRKMLDWTY